MGAIARGLDGTSHSLQHQPKNWMRHNARHILSAQIQFRVRYNRSMELDFVFPLYGLCWYQRYLKSDSRIFHQEAHTALVKPANSDDAISASCQTASWLGWFQHRIHRIRPYAAFNLTGFVAWLLKYNMACCDFLLVRYRCLQRSAKCKNTHHCSSYFLDLRGADITVWDCYPASHEFWPSRESVR